VSWQLTSEHLAWALNRARDHTLALVADAPADRGHDQSAPDERQGTSIGDDDRVSV
jgi:hypothetical protein